MEQELISVIIPIYNVEKYVETCVNSVIGQTYSNLEIILVDDGSTDHSFDICEKLSKTDNRIRAFYKTNGGLSDARNYGIAHASGAFLAFVDGDDWIHPQMLEILRKQLTDDAKVSMCLYETNEQLFTKGSIKISSNVIHKYTGLQALEKRNASLTSACTKLYRKEIFETLRFPEGKLHEDEFVLDEVLLNCEHLIWINLPLYYYIKRDGSITSRISDKRIEDAIEAYKFRLKRAREEWNEAEKVIVKHFSQYGVDMYDLIFSLNADVLQKD